MTSAPSLRRRQLALGTASLAAATIAGLRPGRAADPIRIGDLMSYARLPASATPYRLGAELAVEQINGAGGVLGRPIDFVTRDDGGTPGDALRVAEEFVLRDKVALLTGATLSNVAVALADFARERRTPYVVGECLSDSIQLEKGNRFTMRWNMGTFGMAAALMPAVKQSGAKKWGVLMPNYEYGQSANRAFRRLLERDLPGAQVVVEQFPALGRIDAGATVQALRAGRPDAIFSGLFGPDLDRFIREARTRGLLEDAKFYSIATGSPEWLDPMRDEAPVGWVATGYPWYSTDSADNVAFVKAYQAKYNDYPRRHSTLGYSTVKAAAALVAKAGSTDADALVAAMGGLKFNSPYGDVTIRGLDNQGDTGVWTGTIALREGRGYMANTSFLSGPPVLLPEDEVRRLRPAS